MANGATGAYKGYRLQALYVLHSILSHDYDHPVVFQPEGHEDLAVYRGDTLVEIVQVKARIGALQLSDLRPDQRDSFFNRVADLQEGNPQLAIKIASFGPIGPELERACHSSGSDRDRLIQRITEYGHISEPVARKVFNNLHCVGVSEEELTEAVLTRLKKLAAGIDPDPAFDLLHYWMYQCAEERRKVTSKDVIDKLNIVGKFLAERNAFHTEWFTSIQPMRARSLDEGERARLSAEFRAGISATHDHILAGCDVVRDEKMAALDRLFGEASVVVVHGASGQGKSSLAYRYLYDRFPDLSRYEIVAIENRSHALRIARALSGHAEALAIPFVVYIDVRPGDTDWPELVRQLHKDSKVKILVSIREEDWRRAKLQSHELDFRTLPLTFSETEARLLYESLVQQFTPSHLISFEDAWRQFGGEGPLLEFMYLVNKGETLYARLTQQVQSLRDDVRTRRLHSEELELLRLVSVAGAYGARLRVECLARHLNLPDAGRTMQFFEDEYLLRLSDDRGFVDGLHPIRSAMLADLLTDPVLSPWEKAAMDCITCMDENRLEAFLLHSFGERVSVRSHLLRKLHAFSPKTWVGVAGVIHALLWLGMETYVEENMQLIQEAYTKYGSAWIYALNPDVMGVNPNLAESVPTFVEKYAGSAAAAQMRDIRARQTTNEPILLFASEWLKHVGHAPRTPETEAEWGCVAEAAYWLHRFGISGPLAGALSAMDFPELVDDGMPTIASSLISTLGDFDNPNLPALQQRVIRQFRSEGLVISLDQDPTRVISHFIVPVARLEQGSRPPRFDDPSAEFDVEQPLDEDEDEANRLHDHTMRLVRLMRQIWPQAQVYGTRGYGIPKFDAADGTVGADDTFKEIPQENLPEARLTHLNAVFRGLVQLSLRPADWSEYARTVLQIRQAIVDYVDVLIQLLSQHFGSMQRLSDHSLRRLPFNHVDKLLTRLPLLPRVAVDPWGYGTEDSVYGSVADDGRHQAQHVLLQAYPAAYRPYRPWLRAFVGYVRPVQNFMRQARVFLIPQSFVGRTGEDVRRLAAPILSKMDLPKLKHLTIWNLTEASHALRAMQDNFSFLQTHVDGRLLASVEKRERDGWRTLAHLWVMVALKPRRRWKKPKKAVSRAVEREKDKLLADLSNATTAIDQSRSPLQVISAGGAWKQKPALWLAVNSPTVLASIETMEQMLRALKEVFSNSSDDQQVIHRALWSNVVLASLVGDKMVRPLVVVVPVVVLQRAHTTVVPLLERLDDRTMSTLGLERHDISSLGEPVRFIDSFHDLLGATAHVKHVVESAKKIDDDGLGISRRYFEEFVDSSLSPALQRVIDGLASLNRRANKLATEQYARRSHLLEAVSTGLGLSETVVTSLFDGRDGSMHRISLEQVAGWNELLEEAQAVAIMTYASWAMDVIENG